MRRPTIPRAAVLLLVPVLVGPVLVGAATPALAETSAEPTSAIVRGVVKDTAGNPVPNVTVAPRQVPLVGNEAVRTDANGRYAVRVAYADPDLFNQVPTVNVCAAGETATRVYPKVSPTAADLAFNTRCTPQLIDLTSAPTHFVPITIFRRSTVSGTVTDAKGRPVAGAVVVGCTSYPGPRDADTQDRGDSARTDLKGRYSLSMPAGRAGITVSKTGFVTTSYKGRACENPDNDPPVVIRLETPLPGIDVTLKAQTTTS